MRCFTMRSKHQHMLQDPGAPGARAPARRARSASAAAACSAAAASPARQRRSSAATCRALAAQTFRSSLHRAWACLPGCRRARVWRVWRVWRVPDLHFTGRPARAASARRCLRTWRLPAGCKPGRQAMQRGPGSGTNKHGAGPRRRPALVGMRDRARRRAGQARGPQGGAGVHAQSFHPNPTQGPRLRVLAHPQRLPRGQHVRELGHLAPARLQRAAQPRHLRARRAVAARQAAQRAPVAAPSERTRHSRGQLAAQAGGGSSGARHRRPPRAAPDRGVRAWTAGRRGHEAAAVTCRARAAPPPRAPRSPPRPVGAAPPRVRARPASGPPLAPGPVAAASMALRLTGTGSSRLEEPG